MDRSPELELVQKRFAEVHRAFPSAHFADLRSEQRGGKLCATLGYRRAHRETLFLERYLDQPVEQCLAAVLGRDVARDDVVEIGSLASCNAVAMIALWSRTANDLGGDAEIAVAVLTAPLRRMFQRLGVNLVPLAKADPARLGPERAIWGSYYENDPVVCAGLVAEGQARLARFAARIERQAA